MMTSALAEIVFNWVDVRIWKKLKGVKLNIYSKETVSKGINKRRSRELE